LRQKNANLLNSDVWRIWHGQISTIQNRQEHFNERRTPFREAAKKEFGTSEADEPAVAHGVAIVAALLLPRGMPLAGGMAGLRVRS
jgi:hypothetical protein